MQSGLQQQDTPESSPRLDKTGMTQLLLIDSSTKPIKDALVPLLTEGGFDCTVLDSLAHLQTHVFRDSPRLMLLAATDDEHQQIAQCVAVAKHRDLHPEWEHCPFVVLNTHRYSYAMIQSILDAGALDCYTYDPNQPNLLIQQILTGIHQGDNTRRLEALAKQLNEMNNELYERNIQVERELYTTRQLQQSLLPPFIDEEPMQRLELLAGKTLEHTESKQLSKCHFADPQMRVSGLYLPCDALGGDMYDVISFNNGSLGIAVVDVSGHGVPAAFITAIFKSSFYRITYSYTQPNDILYQLNNELANIVKTGEYLTGFYARLIAEENRLEFSGAGHPYPILYNPNSGKMQRLEENGLPLVWLPGAEYPLGEIMLEPGDQILFFTDGVTEMKNTRGELFGEDALEALFKELVDMGSHTLLDDIIEHLSNYTEGHPLEDDVSMVWLQMNDGLLRF